MEIFDPGQDESPSPRSRRRSLAKTRRGDVQRRGGGRPSLWRAPSEGEPRLKRLVPSERRDDVADVRDWRLLTLKKVLQKRGESAARGVLTDRVATRASTARGRSQPLTWQPHSSTVQHQLGCFGRPRRSLVSSLCELM